MAQNRMVRIRFPFGGLTNEIPEAWLNEDNKLRVDIAAMHRLRDMRPGTGRSLNWATTNDMIGLSDANKRRIIEQQKEELQNSIMEKIQNKREAEHNSFLPSQSKSFCRRVSNGVRKCFGYPPSNNHANRSRTRKARKQKKMTRRVR